MQTGVAGIQHVGGGAARAAYRCLASKRERRRLGVWMGTVAASYIRQVQALSAGLRRHWEAAAVALTLRRDTPTGRGCDQPAETDQAPAARSRRVPAAVGAGVVAGSGSTVPA